MQLQISVFSQYTNFAPYCSTYASCTYPYNTWGNVHIIGGEIYHEHDYHVCESVILPFSKWTLNFSSGTSHNLVLHSFKSEVAEERSDILNMDNQGYTPNWVPGKGMSCSRLEGQIKWKGCFSWMCTILIRLVILTFAVCFHLLSPIEIKLART